ncbi:diguanylate cyclase [Thiorhodococcus minor]|uniref:GGDEF domain-containing protein n=1 Tax=Thiorhodococcus minor TaxID=57489 RepID=A0A6M0K6N9_9GAMM|nr:GGDEF domain-containing protein [Thiorhodococcus minor]
MSHTKLPLLKTASHALERATDSRLGFWKLFTPLAAVPLVVLLLFYHWIAGDAFLRLESLESASVEAQSASVRRLLRDVVADVLILAEENELLEFLETGDQARLEEIASELLAVSGHTQIYDQVRFIDASGREVVRVNYNAGRPAIVPKAQLQDKRGRYYFEEAIGLERGEVYISVLDLNIEHGAIEQPLKPMIRVGTPVVDLNGRKRGIVLVNYLAEELLDLLRSVGRMSSGEAMLLNRDGYWLLGPDPDMSWGFMLPDGQDKRLGIQDPAAWSRMVLAPGGHFYTDLGLYTYRAFDLVAETSRFIAAKVSPGEGVDGRVWYLTTRVPQQLIARRHAEIFVPLAIVGLVILVLLAVGVRSMLSIVRERRKSNERLERLAHLDALTGIANRRAFEEGVAREMARADRHGRRCALLMIDLDGFKAINDTQGHQVGDQVLKDVAKALRVTVRMRSEDSVARFGGDEFAVLLCELPDSDTARAVAEKIRACLSRLRWQGQSVSASIGVALYPEHGAAMSVLLRAADLAMYAAKHAGKDRVALAGELQPPSESMPEVTLEGTSSR